MRRGCLLFFLVEEKHPNDDCDDYDQDEDDGDDNANQGFGGETRGIGLLLKCTQRNSISNQKIKNKNLKIMVLQGGDY